MLLNVPLTPLVKSARGAKTGAFTACAAPLGRAATVTTVPVESTWVTAKVSPPICRNAGMPFAGAVAAGGPAVVVGAGVVVAVVVGPAVVVGAGVVAPGGGVAVIVNCWPVAVSAEKRNPICPMTAAPAACAAGAEPRVTVSFVPVGSTPVTVMVSESTSTLAGAPHGSGATSVMVVSAVPAAVASDDVFAADATTEPGGRLPTFCVRAALSLTVTLWLPLRPGKRADTMTLEAEAAPLVAMPVSLAFLGTNTRET